MNAPVPAIQTAITSLPALVDRAVQALANARTAAEVLDARDMASIAYDIAKKTARIAKAKQAHDDLISAAYRAQADALEIEAQAKRRLADEYDAAQERGEIRKNGENTFSNPEKVSGLEAVAAKVVHEARAIRDAEDANPGVVRRVLDEALDAGEEPTRAKIKRAINPQREHRPPPTRGRDAVRDRVREGVMLLSGLPPAAEVAGYFRGADAAVVVVDRLPAVRQWLTEFFEALGGDQ